MGAEETKLSADQIRTALTDPAMGLPWIWGSLNENEALTEGAVLLVLALFAAFIIYSIFQVSVFRRLSQYSVMQDPGNDGRIRLWHADGRDGIDPCRGIYGGECCSETARRR